MSKIPKPPKVDKKILSELRDRTFKWEVLLKELEPGLETYDNTSEKAEVFFGCLATKHTDETDIIFSFYLGNKAKVTYLGEKVEGTWVKVFKQILKWKRNAIPALPKKK